MAQIGEAIIRFSSDASGTIQAMKDVAASAKDANDQSSSAFDTIKQKIGESADQAKAFATAFLAVGTAVAGVAIGIGVKAVEAYNEYNQVVTQMNAVLKSTKDVSGQTSQSLLEQADSLSSLTGASRETILEGQNMLLTFGEIKGKTFPEATQAILDMATAMNGGLIPSGDQLKDTAIQVGKALNDPTTGLTALRRVGIEFTDAQKEQILVLQAGGDAAGAQALILKELEKEFGGSAAAAGDTFAGQINKAKNTLHDLEVEIGTTIVAHLQPLVAEFNSWTASIGGPQAVLNLLIQKVKDFGDVLMQHKQQIELVAGAISGILVEALIAWTVELGAAAIETVTLLGPIALIGAAIVALANIFISNSGGISNAVKRVKSDLTDVKEYLEKNVIPVIEKWGAVVAGILMPPLRDMWDMIRNQLLPAIKDLLDLLEPHILPILRDVAAFITATLIGAFDLLVVAIWGLEEAIKAVVAILTGMIRQLDDVWNAIHQFFNGDIKAGFKDLGDAIELPFKAAFDFIKSGVDDAKKALGTLSSVGINIPHFASGVRNFSGGLALVGENGPELVNLPAGSDVFNNSDTSSMVQGATPTAQSPTGTQSGTQNVYNIGVQTFLGTPQELRSFAELLTREQARLTNRT